jgi:hypothetical protein
VLDIGKQAGTISNPIAQFSVGAAALINAKEIASARGTADNKNQANNTVITNSSLDTTIYFGADESFNLVSNDENVRDEIAAALYFKDLGSRKGLTIAQSNLEYEASADNVKNVYTSKAISDVRKLVTEGYIKVGRQSQDVEIATEKAAL